MVVACGASGARDGARGAAAWVGVVVCAPPPSGASRVDGGAGRIDSDGAVVARLARPARRALDVGLVLARLTRDACRHAWGRRVLARPTVRWIDRAARALVADRARDAAGLVANGDGRAIVKRPLHARHRHKGALRAIVALRAEDALGAVGIRHSWA